MSDNSDNNSSHMSIGSVSEKDGMGTKVKKEKEKEKEASENNSKKRTIDEVWEETRQNERKRRLAAMASREGRDGVERRNKKDHEWLERDDETTLLKEKMGKMRQDMIEFCNKLTSIQSSFHQPPPPSLSSSSSSSSSPQQPVTIMSFLKLAHQLDDRRKTKERAYVFYPNGKLTNQKGGDLLWDRTEFVTTPSITLAPIVSFATPDDPHKSFVYVTEEEGEMLHNQLRTLYGIPETLKYSDCQRMLGYSMEEIYLQSLLPENAGKLTDQIHIPKETLDKYVSDHRKRMGKKATMETSALEPEPEEEAEPEHEHEPETEDHAKTINK